MNVSSCLSSIKVLHQHLDIRHILQSTMMWLVIITLSFAGTACGSRFNLLATTEPTPTPTLEPTRFAALIYGKFVDDEGCLRIIERTTSVNYLIVWPPEFSIRTEQDRIIVTKGNGEEVTLRIGEEIRLGGGEVDSRDVLDERVKEALPEHCPGPYWVAGLEVAPVEATEESK